MSGKFMKVKKIFIPTLTALLIASQLTGCASASQSEMLEMINNQQAICIEVAVPESVEQGEEKQLDWVELAYKTNYEMFRMEFDDALNITAFGEGGKNGTVYVDLDGNHTDNSTLYYAMMNKKFREQIADTDTNEALISAAYNNYADVETSLEARLAYFNAYFGLLDDADPNYYNGRSTVTRAEFLGALYKAQNPVSDDIEAPADFYAVVDRNGENTNTDFAYQLLAHSYLGVEDKSLTEDNFNGTITRGEAIYTIVSMYYADELGRITSKDTCFSDIKNGGDIASRQKFVETTKDKETKELITTYKDYWKAYELQYAIENADKGAPADIYNAMVVAKKLGLITGDFCRWDEALTKSETIHYILKVYESMSTITNADRGAAVGEVVANTESIETNNPYADYGKTDESLADYEVEITEELNTQMYVIKDSNILKLDQEGAGAIAPAEVGAYLTVTGKTSNGWYEVDWGNSKGYLPADILGNENPNSNTQPAPSDTVSDSGRPADEVLEDFWELVGEGWDDGSGGGISQEAIDNQTVTPDFDKTPNW